MASPIRIESSCIALGHSHCVGCPISPGNLPLKVIRQGYSKRVHFDYRSLTETLTIRETHSANLGAGLERALKQSQFRAVHTPGAEHCGLCPTTS